MQLRTKFYPYPVLVEGGAYYDGSEFFSTVKQSIEGYSIKFKLTAKLKDANLENLLQSGIVKIVHHIECPQTCFRRIIKTSEYSINYLIKDANINGIVQICTFIIAEQDIDKYTSDSFSNDYKGFKFNIEKGCIMAIGNQYNLRINKIRDDLANTSSIFSIVPNTNITEENMQVDLGQQKIVITLPEKTYHQYFNIQNYIDVQPVMHSMIIIPALIYTLEELRADGEQLYLREENRWFRSLKKACKAIGISFDEQGLLNMDILKVSQQLLDGPISKAIEYCSMGGGTYEN